MLYTVRETVNNFLRVNALPTNLAIRNMLELIETKKEAVNGDSLENLTITDLYELTLKSNKQITIGLTTKSGRPSNTK